MSATDLAVLSTAAPDRDDPILGDPAMPAWFAGFRGPQWDAVTQAIWHFQAGRKVVFLDAPTGTGKTVIGETIRRVLGARRALYVCSTKSLQTQFLADFPYAELLQGRSNYPTADHPQRFRDRFDALSAADCMKTFECLPACDTCTEQERFTAEPVRHCNFCHPVSACPYERAKEAALGSPLAVLNTAYLLAEANNVGMFGEQTQDSGEGPSTPDLVIVDECDTLESSVMSFVNLTLSRRQREELGIGLPEVVTAGAKSAPVAWAKWFYADAIPAVKARLDQLVLPEHPPVELVRERQRVERLHADLNRVAADVLAGGWVLTDYESGSVTWKRVRVDPVAEQALWRHGQRFLCMSATIIEPHELAASLGLPDSDWACVTVPNSFPAEHRPIYPVPVADVTHKNKDAAWPALATAILKIMERHPHERILVHTVSYALSKYLFEHLPRGRTVIYSDGRDRENALNIYKGQRGAVLLAASMDRGIDLPGQLCEVQVVAKMPFVSLGDKQVSARMYSPGGQLWYSVATIRSLVQMTGRGVRSAEDRCTTYILDQQFVSNVWRKNRHLLPAWWKEALVWDFPVRSLMA